MFSFYLDKLPKSHIPSSVPLFTGREEEIKEISNLITHDSTRLVNIWGSPGFGKTATAIDVAHHLSSLENRVYFFKLQGITTIDKLLYKILSIFKSSLVDVDLAPVDKLVSIFREVFSPVILIFDNLDDLLLSETSSAELFVEFLDSNAYISVILTTTNSEEMASKVLEELHSPENRLDHFEKNMQKFLRDHLSSLHQPTNMP